MVSAIRLMIAAGGVGLALAATPAEAQDRSQQEAWCVNSSGSYSADLVIGGCTALIQSGAYDAANLAILFNNRGLVRLLQQRWQDAWNDYDAAAKLEPASARGLYGRGLAAEKQGRAAEAQRYKAEALRLDPEVAKDFSGVN